MPLNIGIGDIFCVIKYIRSFINALNDSRGSSQEYLEMVAVLRSLELSLIQVEGLYPALEQPRQRSFLYREVTDCQVSINMFLGTLDKYHGHLSVCGTESNFLDSLRKIQWHLVQPEELKNFKSTISLHFQALQITLGTIAIEVQTNSQKRHDSNTLAIQSVLNGIVHSLELINASVSDQSTSLVHQDELSATILARVEGLQSQIPCLLANHARIANEIIKTLHTSIPSQVLWQKPVTLLDAMNRRFPINLEFINCKEAFITVLALQFKEKGATKITSEEFALRCVGKNADIDLHSGWPRWFCPGQNVNMSMIFSSESIVASSVCPACNYQCPGESDAEIECPNCNTCFRRITEEEGFVERFGAKDPTMKCFQTSSHPEIKTDDMEQLLSKSSDRVEDFRRVRIVHRHITPPGLVGIEMNPPERVRVPLPEELLEAGMIHPEDNNGDRATVIPADNRFVTPEKYVPSPGSLHLVQISPFLDRGRPPPLMADEKSPSEANGHSDGDDVGSVNKTPPDHNVDSSFNASDRSEWNSSIGRAVGLNTEGTEANETMMQMSIGARGLSDGRLDFYLDSVGGAFQELGHGEFVYARDSSTLLVSSRLSPETQWSQQSQVSASSFGCHT